MASLDELRAVRLQKLEALKAAGMDPYPAHVSRDLSLAAAKSRFEELERDGSSLSLVGRIMSLRGQGAIQFVTLYDGTEKFQVVIKKDTLSPEQFELFGAAIDLGDFIQVIGTLFTTQRGEPSLLAQSWTIVSKSLLPPPSEYYGFEDPDERQRKRYLDILMNPELKELFEKKAKFWEVVRGFMKSRGFTEVETPTLEVTTGGAEANPFKTYHKDFDLEVFLRISIGELWQKRLMAAGFDKTFEIGRAYRNEGSSPEHLQEFTNMEFYWAYADYNDGMALVQDLYRTIAREVFGKTEFTTRGHTFDMANEWERIDYVSKVQEITGINVLTATEDEMKAKLAELNVQYTGNNRERLMDTLWKYCRKTISGPAFLINHPKLIAPLSKSHPDNPELTQKFQPLMAGSEIGNGYSELNDPLDQRARFELQQQLIERGDDEAMMPEWDFVEMLEHGMPPTCGFGFGERLFAFLVDKPIREVQLFPLVKPKE